jgi:hypothetical protein
MNSSRMGERCRKSEDASSIYRQRWHLDYTHDSGAAESAREKPNRSLFLKEFSLQIDAFVDLSAPSWSTISHCRTLISFLFPTPYTLSQLYASFLPPLPYVSIG